MTAAALARQLPPTMQITWVNGRGLARRGSFFRWCRSTLRVCLQSRGRCLGAAPDGGHRYRPFPGARSSWTGARESPFLGAMFSPAVAHRGRCPVPSPSLAARRRASSSHSCCRQSPHARVCLPIPVEQGSQASGPCGVWLPVQSLFLYEPVRGGGPGAAGGKVVDGRCRQRRMSARARFPRSISPTARRSKRTCSSTARGPMRGCCHAWVWKSHPAGGCEQR